MHGRTRRRSYVRIYVNGYVNHGYGISTRAGRGALDISRIRVVLKADGAAWIAFLKGVRCVS